MFSIHALFTCFASFSISAFKGTRTTIFIRGDMFFCCYRFGNTAYLHISVAFIQMLKALSMFLTNFTCFLLLSMTFP